VLVDCATRLREVHVGQARVVRAAGCEHYVVDRFRQILEETLEVSRIGRVEGRAAQRAELERGVLEALGIAGREDDVGSLSARSSDGFEPEPALPPITTTVCPSSSDSRG